MPAENLHLTLAFIGEYGNPDNVLDAMDAAPFEPFHLSLDGVGHFGDLYWAGIEDNDMLSKYVRRLRRSLSDYGIPFDCKRFSPHITLVRRAAFQSEPFFDLSPRNADMEVQGISLMRSERGKHGMIYTEIGTVGSES